MIRAWTLGNRGHLFENGDAFFPRAPAAIDAARNEVPIETFILFEAKVCRRLRAVLAAAAQRGVRVALPVDGYGSPDLSPALAGALPWPAHTPHGVALAPRAQDAHQ